MKFQVGDLFTSNMGCLMYIEEYMECSEKYKVRYYEPNIKNYSYLYHVSSIETIIQENGGWKYFPVKT